MKRAKLFKRMLAGILAGVMCGSMSIGAFASEAKENVNIWYGDEISREVIAGENGYTFMSLYKSPYANYETSNHVLQKAGAVSLLPMIDASKDYTWKPNGLYKPYESNYEVMYCCDLDTDYNDGIYYKRLNLEDSEYFDDEQARKIRAIVTNSYPYVSLETMKEKLAETGFEDAEKIDRAEAIAAVQAAIWNCANGHEDTYKATANLSIVGKDWGGIWHDYMAEMSQEIQTQTKRDVVYPKIGARLEALTAHLLTLEESYADKAQIIISKLEMRGKPVEVNEDTVKLLLDLELNNSGSGIEDDIEITISSSCDTRTFRVDYGTEKYSVEIKANRNDEVKAVVSGTQVLPEGVYFYAPKAADINNDGIATSREVSQNLVGVAMGATPVYAEASIDLHDRVINFEKTTTSEQGLEPLEGIVFDIYYAGSVDAYTKYVAEVSKTYGGNKDNKKEFMAAVQDKFEDAKANEIKANNVAPVATVVTDITGKAVYNLTKDGQEDGIYLIIEREHPAIVKPLDPFIVAVPMTSEDGKWLNYSVNINPKNEVLPGPEVEKNVTQIGTDLDSFDVGATHTWILRGDVPVDIANGKYYIMEDVLDDRLDYQGNVKVVVAAKNVLAGEESIVLKADKDYILTTHDNNTDDKDNKGDTFKVELTADGMKAVAEATAANTVDANADNKVNYKDMEIRTYFDSLITQAAVVGTEIPNEVSLKYKNSVGIEFEDKDDAKVYTCGINIKKYDAKDITNFLAGAEFMIARKATDAEIADETIKTESLVTSSGHSEVVVFVNFYNNADLTGKKVNTIVTNETGDAIIYGLKEGSYYLVETKAPAGYNLLSYPVEITLNKVSDSSTIEVANSDTFELPGTGGIGTTIFTVVGAALTLGSGAVLIGKKREEEVEETEL